MFNKKNCYALLLFLLAPLMGCSPGEEVARFELSHEADRVFVEHIASDIGYWGGEYNWRMSEDGKQHILYVEKYPWEGEVKSFALRLQRNLDAKPVTTPEKVSYTVRPANQEQVQKLAKSGGGDISASIPLVVDWGQAEVSVYGPAIDLAAYGFGDILGTTELTCTYRFPVAQDIPDLSYRQQIVTQDNGEKLAQFPALAEAIAKMNAAMPVETIEHTVAVEPNDLQPLFDTLQLQYAQYDGLFWVSPKGIRKHHMHTPLSNNSYIADCEDLVMETAPTELLILGGDMPLVGKLRSFSISEPPANEK